MKLRTIYILFIVLGGLLALFAVALWTAAPEADLSLFVFPSAHDSAHPLAPADVGRVEIKRTRPNAETLVFVRDAQTSRWAMEEPHKLRAGPAVDELVRQVLDASRDPQAGDRSLKDAGLDPAAAVVTLTTTADDKKGPARTLTMDVGEVTSKSAQAVIYVASPERPHEVMPVPRSSLSAVLDGVNEFRDPYLLASSSGDYTRVKLSRSAPDGKPLELKKVDGGVWRCTDSAGYDGTAEMGDAAASTEPGARPSGVNGLLKVLSDLGAQPGDWVEDGGTSLLDKPEYGLDASKADVLTIEIKRDLPAAADLDPDKKAGPPPTAEMTLRVGLGKKVGDKADHYYAAVTEPDGGVSVLRIAAAGPDSVAKEFEAPAALRSKTLVALGAAAEPVAVTVVGQGGAFRLLREKAHDPWKLYRDDSKEPAAVDEEAARLLVNQLTQPGQVRDFLDPNYARDDPSLGEPATAAATAGLLASPSWPGPFPAASALFPGRAPAVVISFYVEGVRTETQEPKKNDKGDVVAPAKSWLVLDADKAKPAARLSFSAKALTAGQPAAALREANHPDWSERAFVQTPYEIAEMAEEGPLHYYDKTLPTFATAFSKSDVVGLEVVRADGDYVLSRRQPLSTTAAGDFGVLAAAAASGPVAVASALGAGGNPEDFQDSPWAFEKPDSGDRDYRKFKAGGQVDDILRMLDSLRAVRLVSETPTPAALEKYGLKEPAVKVVLTKHVPDKDGKPAYDTFTYSFGQPKPGGPVYGQQSQRPLVFEVDAKVLTDLQQELRDRAVFAFDPAKVKTLKMTGWQKTSGQRLTRLLERNADGSWTMKEPPDVKMDFGRVNLFVRELSALQAKSFAPPGSEVAKEFARQAADSLTIEIKVEGVDEPYALEVVDLTDDKNVTDLAARQVYAKAPKVLGDQIFEAPRDYFKAPPTPPIGPLDGAGYFSPSS